MVEILWVGAGGALGSAARHAVWMIVAPRSAGFPLATLLVNVSGSLVLGLLAGVFSGRVPDSVRLFVFIGALGGYTTFSTFTVDTVELVRVGEVWPAISNLALSIAVGLLAAVAGIVVGEAMAG